MKTTLIKKVFLKYEEFPMTFKLEWEGADSQHQVSTALLMKMVRMAYPNKKIISWKMLSGGCANLNVKIQLENDKNPYLLRIYIRDQLAAYREQKLGEILKSTLPVPETYYIGDCEGYRFAITDFMPGITLHALLLGDFDYDISAVMYEVGVILSKISSYSFAQAGFFDKDLNTIKPIARDDYLIFAQECLQSKMVLSQLMPQTIGQINDLLKKYSQFFLDEHEKNLVHGDFDPANILVDKIKGRWTVAGILDWEFAFSGSTLFDVANMLRYAHLMPEQFEKAFLFGVCSDNIVLPEHWRISIHVLNLLSLLNLLVRSDPKRRPNQCADIHKLIDHIIKELSL